MPTHAAPSPPEPSRARRDAFGPLLGLSAYYALIAGGYLHATRVAGWITWPFSRAASADEVYLRALSYAPVLLLSLATLAFVRAAGRPVRPLFTTGRLDWLGYLMLFACAGYAAYVLGRHVRPAGVLAFLPPLLLLCAMNALAEETAYRGSFLELLRGVTDRGWLVNTLQALAYAAPHGLIGPKLAGLAFLLGLGLGALRLRGAGLWPCVVCHLIVDLGAIGSPLLPRLPG